MKINPSSDNPATNNESTADASPANSSASLTIPKTIGLCAIGLLVSFFLPWAGVFGQSISGFDLQKMPGNPKWLWIIPVFSVITILAALTGRCRKIAAIFTGALPFCVLAYWLNQLGSELLRTLGLGAWLSLICGLA